MLIRQQWFAGYEYSVVVIGMTTDDADGDEDLTTAYMYCFELFEGH